MQTIFRISATHNGLLQAMIEHLLITLPGKPVMNQKKTIGDL